jgi:acylphosphatase
MHSNLICYNIFMKTLRAHIFIEGRVQGVFYRAFTRNLAVRLGLKLQKFYDGRVER